MQIVLIIFLDITRTRVVPVDTVQYTYCTCTLIISKQKCAKLSIVGKGRRRSCLQSSHRFGKIRTRLLSPHSFL